MALVHIFEKRKYVFCYFTPFLKCDLHKIWSKNALTVSITWVFAAIYCSAWQFLSPGCLPLYIAMPDSFYHLGVCRYILQCLIVSITCVFAAIYCSAASRSGSCPYVTPACKVSHAEPSDNLSSRDDTHTCSPDRTHRGQYMEAIQNTMHTIYHYQASLKIMTYIYVYCA